MTKRPLCLLAVLWILFILTGKAFGLLSDGRQADAFEVHLSGQITSYEMQEHSIQYNLKNIKFQNNSNKIQSYPHRLRCIVRDKTSIAIGKTVEVCGTLRNIAPPGNPGAFDARRYYAGKDIFCEVFADSICETGGKVNAFAEKIADIKSRCREKLCALAGTVYGGTLSAILLGDKGELDSKVKAGYTAGGVLHLLSISGLHLTMLGLFVYQLLVQLRLPFSVSAAGAGILLGIYTYMTGMAVSSCRAYLMFLVVLGAKLSGRAYDLLSSLSLAVLLLLLENPQQLFYSGFQLSVTAVFAAGFVCPTLKDSRAYRQVKSKREKYRKKLLESLETGLVLQIFLLPLLTFYFYEIPVFAVAVNLLLLPFFSLILGFGALGCIVALGSELFGRLCLFPAVLLLKGYDTVLALVQKMPGSLWVVGAPALWQLAVFYGGALLLLYYWSRRRRWILEKKTLPKQEPLLQILFAGLLFCITLWRPSPGFSLTALDVGQGDCIVVQNDRHTWLIDGGSSTQTKVGSYQILPYLKYRGIAELEAVVITHTDADHSNGIEELLEKKAKGEIGLRIQKLLLPLWLKGSADEKKLCLLAKRAGASVGYLQKGDRLGDSDCHMEVLHPDRRDYRKEKNEGSVTIRLTKGSFSALFTGDLEGAAEQRLLSDLQKTDFLKLAHHGSKGATSEEFLQRLDPRFAFISCGAGNRYGHPHSETLQRLKNHSVRYWTTEQNGALRLSVKGEKIKIVTYR